jgi:hypothetical protein
MRGIEGQMLTPLRQFIDVNIDSALGMQAKLNDARKEYETCTEKLYSTRKKASTSKEPDTEKLARVEADEAKTKQQFELLQYQYAKKMSELLQDVPYTLIDGLAGYIGSRAEYYRKSGALMGVLEPEMKQFTAQATALKRASAETRLEEMRKRLDTSSRAGSIAMGVGLGVSQAPVVSTASMSDLGAFSTSPASLSVQSSSSSGPSPSHSHSLLAQSQAGGSSEKQRQLSGYLWMKTKGRWKKRWVSVMNGKLMYYKNWKNHQPKGSLNRPPRIRLCLSFCLKLC